MKNYHGRNPRNSCIALILGISAILSLSSCGSESPTTPPLALNRITETKDISYAGFKRITVRVLINKDSTETSAREVAEYVVKKKKSEISGLKGITIWGYYNPPGRGAWEAFYAEWQRNRGLYAFKFEEPFVVATPKKLAEDEYVEIIGNQVNVRLSPATSSPIIAKGRKGDLFKLKGDEGKWYKISISSGEYRYVHKSLTKAVRYEISLPNSEATRRGIFKALLSAEDRAQAEADREYPITGRASLVKNVEYMRILDDRYKLNVMHEFGVQSPIYIKILVEGVKKNW